MKYKYFSVFTFSLFVLELTFCKSAYEFHLTSHRVLHRKSPEFHRAEKYVEDVIKTKLEEGPLSSTNSSSIFPDVGGNEVEYLNEIDKWLKKEFDDKDKATRKHQVIILTRFYIDKNEIAHIS